MINLDKKFIRVHYNVLNSNNKSKRMYVSHNFKICIVFEGKAIWKIGDTEYQIDKNNVILLNNRDERIFKQIDKGITLKLFCIEFEPQTLYKSSFLPLFINRIKGFNPVLPNQLTSDIVSLMWMIESEALNQKSDFETVISINLMTMLIYIKRCYESLGIKFNEQYTPNEISKAIHYINENYDKEISLSKVSELMHMSASAFSKYFLKYNGIGFNQYINKKRIDKAIYLLETTDETVLSIAMACGFNNGACFYQTFHKFVNATPMSFRGKTNLKS